MTGDTERDMKSIEEVARITGARALRHFRTSLTVDTKGDGSPVTIADREAEAAARAWIEQRFPEDGIVGEEEGAVRAGAERQWLIDPIDGTNTFVRGVPLWGTLIALVVAGRVQTGVAFFPVLGEMLVASRGAGSWYNGARTRVSGTAEISSATALTTDERFRGTSARRAGWERLSGRCAISRSWGDCYGYMLVATGRAEVMVDPVLAEWDAAPFQPIIEEAGGVLTDWAGIRTPFGGNAIATNRALAAESRKLLDCPYTEGPK